MKSLRLILACCCLLLLLPAPLHAAPRQENLGCRLPGTELFSWLTGMTTVKRTVVIDRIELHLSICAPSSESYSAEQMLDLFSQALPHLSAHAGVPLYGSKDRLIVMVARNQLMPFADGQLSEEDNIIELHSRSTEWTVVHEGAHYWANAENFHEAWMVEGYAEYLTEQALNDMGSNLRVQPPEAVCDTAPLRSWHNTGLNDCGYTAGAAVFRALSRAVGEDRFKQVLRMLATSNGITSDTLLAGLERASGEDLLDQMRPVFPIEEFSAIKRQRELLHELRMINQRAVPLGINPPAQIITAIQRNDFNTASAWLAGLSSFLPAAESLQARCVELTLDCAPIWQALPAEPSTLPALEARLNEAAALLSQLAPLQKRAQEQQIELPAALIQKVAAFDPSAVENIRQANEGLDKGLELERRCDRMDAPCSGSWRARWTAGAFEDARQGIDRTSQVLVIAETVEKRCEGFVTTCHGFWHAALQQERLEEAARALQALDQAIARAQRVRQNCADVSAVCWKTWTNGLANGHIQGADRALEAIEAMLARARRLQQDCTSDWPCQASWQAVYRQTSDPQAAIARMDGIEDRLGHLKDAARIISSGRDKNGARPETMPLAEAQQALIDGQIDRAVAIADEVAAAQVRRQQIRSALPLAGTVLLAVPIVVGAFLLLRARQRRPKRAGARHWRAPASDADLLAALLAEPPRARRPRR